MVGRPSCHPTNNVKTLKEEQSTDPNQWPGFILSLSNARLLSEGALLPLHWLSHASGWHYRQTSLLNPTHFFLINYVNSLHRHTLLSVHPLQNSTIHWPTVNRNMQNTETKKCRSQKPVKTFADNNLRERNDVIMLKIQQQIYLTQAAHGKPFHQHRQIHTPSCHITYECRTVIASSIFSTGLCKPQTC